MEVTIKLLEGVSLAGRPPTGDVRIVPTTIGRNLGPQAVVVAAELTRGGYLPRAHTKRSKHCRADLHGGRRSNGIRIRLRSPGCSTIKPGVSRRE